MRQSNNIMVTQIIMILHMGRRPIIFRFQRPSLKQLSIKTYYMYTVAVDDCETP
jgi:hypothetical protein